MKTYKDSPSGFICLAYLSRILPTVGESRVRGLPAVQAAERSVQSGLPLSDQLDRVLLIPGTQAPNSWRVLHEFGLGPAGP